MAASIDRADSHRDDLAELTSGADQLAAGLTELDDRLRGPLTSLSALMPHIADAAPLLTALRPNRSTAVPDADRIIRLTQSVAPMAETAKTAVAALEHLEGDLANVPWCLTTPQCGQVRDQVQMLVALRDNGFFDKMSSFADSSMADPDRVRSLLHGLSAFAQAGGDIGSPTDITDQISRMQSGISRLAAGARRLSTGVHALVDSNLAQLSGMSQVAAQLQESARATTGADSSSGFYLPPDALQRPEFTQVAQRFITPHGRTTRFAVESEYDPYSPQATELNHRILEAARAALPNTPLASASVAIAGFTAFNSDTQELIRADTVQTSVVTLLIVTLILIVLLRSAVAPLYLVATVVLNFLAALGLTTVVFQLILDQEIVSTVPILAFIILVAVGADYNMLLVSRLREESTANARVGVIRTVANTGSVISSAGLIFAASMLGLLAGSVNLMLQVGFFVGMGLLLDTFVVRTLTVPAIATLLREKNWWPSRQRA